LFDILRLTEERFLVRQPLFSCHASAPSRAVCCGRNEDLFRLIAAWNDAYDLLYRRNPSSDDLFDRAG
jgi:hypothetical protein